MVIAAIATAAGVRADICVIAVPRTGFVVCEPTHDSGVKQSDPYDSAAQIECRPSSSTTWVLSLRKAWGFEPQYPMSQPSSMPASSCPTCAFNDATVYQARARMQAVK